MPACLTLLPIAGALAIAFAYLNFSIGFWNGVAPFALWASTLAALALVVPLWAVPSRFRLAAAALLLVCLHAAVIGDLTYFRFSRDLFTVRSLAFGHQLLHVATSPLALLRARDALLLVASAVAMWAMVRSGREAGGEPPFRRRAVQALAVTAATLGLLAGSIWLLGRHSGLRLSDTWSRVRLAVTIGAAPHHMLEACQLLEEAFRPALGPAEVAALEAWLAGRPSAGLSPTWAMARRRSLIVLQLESLQAFAVGLRVGGVPVTPNLDALATRARYYPNLYTQTQTGGTSDAEFIAATGMHPFATGAVFVSGSRNHYTTALPATLKRAGYGTVVHNGYLDPNFWNRAAMYPALGYARFVDGNAFGPGECFGPGLGDHVFLERSAARLAAEPRPFQAMVITMSGHHPFAGFDLRVPGKFDGVGDETVARYLKGVHYVDACVGRFIADLERAGLWDDAVVAIYGDHPAFGIAPPALTRLIGDTEAPAAARRFRSTPLFLHVPGDRVRGRQDVAVGQLDLMPTLAHVLGVEAPTALGSSIADPRPAFVAFRDGGVISGRRYHHAQPPGAWDLGTGRVAPALPASHLDHARRQLAASDLMIRGDLMARIAATSRLGQAQD